MDKDLYKQRWERKSHYRRERNERWKEKRIHHPEKLHRQKELNYEDASRTPDDK
jgi:hypothetical protein